MSSIAFIFDFESGPKSQQEMKPLDPLANFCKRQERGTPPELDYIEGQNRQSFSAIGDTRK
jgi:hypothetical protein